MLVHGSELVARPEIRAALESRGLRSPADVIAAFVKEPADPKRRSRIAEVDLAGGRYFLKTYDYSWPDRFRTALIPARARREYRNLEMLASLGLKVTEAAAYGQTRVLGFVTSSFVMTRAVENAVDLRELADGRKPPFPPPDRRVRRELIVAFARQLRACHDAGWFLHTAFFKNLLLTQREGRHELSVIDVPFAGIWRNRLIPSVGRRRDFACLQKGAVGFLTPGERLAFYRAYRGSGRLEPADKSFLRAVTAYVKGEF